VSRGFSIPRVERSDPARKRFQRKGGGPTHAASSQPKFACAADTRGYWELTRWRPSPFRRFSRSGRRQNPLLRKKTAAHQVERRSQTRRK